MKKCSLIMLSFVLLTFGVFVQSINANEVEKFTKKQVIETSFEKIVSDNSVLGSTGGSLMKNIWVAFRQVGDNEYLRLKGCTNSIIALSEKAEVIFWDNEGNTYTFKNTEYTIAGQGEGTVGMYGSALFGLSIYLIGDCSNLENKNITDLKIHTTDGYLDFKIDRKSTEIISKSYQGFNSARQKIN